MPQIQTNNNNKHHKQGQKANVKLGKIFATHITDKWQFHNKVVIPTNQFLNSQHSSTKIDKG